MIVEADEDATGLVRGLPCPRLELASARLVPAQFLQRHAALVYAAYRIQFASCRSSR